MKKTILFLLFIVLPVRVIISQTITGKLVNQDGEGQSGLQLKLYVNPAVYTTESSSDGSFIFDNLTSVSDTKLAAGLTISDCYPNPFSETTRINVTLPKSGNIKVDVYNLQGQRMMSVLNQFYDAGENYIDINLTGLMFGTYLAKITIDDIFIVGRKMIFQKGNVQTKTIANNVRFKSASFFNAADETKIDSLVVSGASIDKKVFFDLPALTGTSINLGVLTVTETNNILDGASFFSGSVPATGLVTYHEGDSLVGDSAYLGQVFVFFDASVAESSAKNIISGNGGNILTKIPRAGYYLVGVPIGKEGAFIDSLANDSTVKTAMPNIVARYMSSGVKVIDGCRKSHGTLVTCTLFHNTPNSTSVTCLDDDDGYGNPKIDKIIEHIMSTIAESKGGNTIINISSFGGLNGVDYENETTEWKDTLLRRAERYLRSVLTPISQLPESWSKNLVITFCAGNDNTPLTSVLAKLRSDIMIEKVLRNNVLIVGANDEIFHHSNDAPNDPDFANMLSVTSPCGTENQKGTSFAAPLAAAFISNLVDKGLTAKQALQATKIAIASNSKNEFIEAEAQMIANSIKNGNSNVGVYSGGPYTVTDQMQVISICYAHFTMGMNMTVSLDGNSGTMSIPSNFSYTVSGQSCFAIGVTANSQVFKGDLTLSNNNLTGIAAARFLAGQGSCPATAKFTGILNPNQTITGSLTISSAYINQSTVVTLTKQ